MAARTLVFFFAAAIWLAAIDQTAFAQDQKPPQPGGEQAQKLIDDCWALSLTARESGVTADMANGTYKTIKCMEEAILDQTEILFPGRGVARADIRGWLDQIAMLRKYYSNLWENNRSCDPSCGTIQLTLYALPHADLLETMIRDTVAVHHSEAFQTSISNQEKRKARQKSK